MDRLHRTFPLAQTTPLTIPQESAERNLSNRGSLLMHAISGHSTVIYVPTITTILTYAQCLFIVDCFLFFMTEYFKNNCRYGKNNPFNRHPPPTYYQPPQTAMMCIFHMYFIDNLNFDIITLTLWTDHFQSFQI